jgi:hypothetical protein
MTDTSHGSITREDVEAFTRDMQKEQESQTPEEALQKLISSGFLKEDGQVRYPNPDAPRPNGTKGVNGRK